MAEQISRPIQLLKKKKNWPKDKMYKWIILFGRVETKLKLLSSDSKYETLARSEWSLRFVICTR